jgi:nucleoside-diphosphate-sugar epimerase
MPSHIKQCLITGASGFIGKALCHALQKRNIKIRALLRQSKIGFWDEAIIHDLCKPMPPHLENTLMKNIDTVFYLASVPYNINCEYPQNIYWRLHVDATETIFHLAAKAKVCRFIYFSSVKAIGTPKDIYGQSKQAGEHLVIKLGKYYNLHVCILQPTLVYGPPYLRGGLLFLFQSIKSNWFPIPPPVQSQRSLVSINDVVRAAWIVANHPTANGKTYIVADKMPYSIRQLYDAMRKELGLKPIAWSFPDWLLKIISKTYDLIAFLFKKTLYFNSVEYKRWLNTELYSPYLLQQELPWQSNPLLFKRLPKFIYHTINRDTYEH